MNPIRVIGLGNAAAGEDGIGLMILERLERDKYRGVDFLQLGQAGLTLLDLMADAETAMIVDAVQSGQHPGVIHRLEIPRDIERVSALSRSTTSTHAFGLGEAFTLGMALGILPSKVLVFGIEISHVTPDQKISDSVLKAMEEVALEIIHELEGFQCMNSN